MKSTRQTNSTESDSIVAETCMLQLQLPYEGIYTNQVVEHKFGIGEDFQVYSGPISASRSLLPNLQIPTNVNDYLTMNSHPQSHLGTLGNFRADTAEKTGPDLTGPLTVLPITTTSQEVMSYSEDVWDLHKPRIRHLYLEEGRKLSEVMHQMKEEEGFKPS